MSNALGDDPDPLSPIPPRGPGAFMDLFRSHWRSVAEHLRAREPFRAECELLWEAEPYFVHEHWTALRRLFQQWFQWPNDLLLPADNVAALMDEEWDSLDSVEFLLALEELWPAARIDDDMMAGVDWSKETVAAFLRNHPRSA